MMNTNNEEYYLYIECKSRYEKIKKNILNWMVYLIGRTTVFYASCWQEADKHGGIGTRAKLAKKE